MMNNKETLALQRLSAEQDDLRERTAVAVARCRAAGAAWSDVGEALGMTRQAAHERFRHVDVAADDRYVKIACKCGSVTRYVGKPAPAVPLRCQNCRPRG